MAFLVLGVASPSNEFLVTSLDYMSKILIEKLVSNKQYCLVFFNIKLWLVFKSILFLINY